MRRIAARLVELGGRPFVLVIGLVAGTIQGVPRLLLGGSSGPLKAVPVLIVGTTALLWWLAALGATHADVVS